MVTEKVPLWKQGHNFFAFDPGNLPVDELDQRIIQTLIENSRTSNTDIAKQLDVNESTVRRRIEGLISKDIIKGFTVCLKNPELQSYVRAYIYVKVDTPALDEVVEYLCTSENTLSVYRIVGAYDVVCEMVFNTMGDMHAFYDELFKRSVVHDIMAHIIVNCYKTLPFMV